MENVTTVTSLPFDPYSTLSPFHSSLFNALCVGNYNNIIPLAAPTMALPVVLVKLSAIIIFCRKVMALKKSTSTPLVVTTIKRNEITITRRNGSPKILHHLKKKKSSKIGKRLIWSMNARLYMSIITSESLDLIEDSNLQPSLVAQPSQEAPNLPPFPTSAASTAPPTSANNSWIFPYIFNNLLYLAPLALQESMLPTQMNTNLTLQTTDTNESLDSCHTGYA